MRIAHITSVFLPYQSGISYVVYHNAVEQAKLGHQVTVYTANYGDVGEIPENMQVKHLRRSFQIGNAPFLPGLLSIREADIIHLHYPFPFGHEFTWLLAKWRGIPYVVTHHNDLVGNGLRRPIFRAYVPLIVRPFIRGAKAIIAVTTDHTQHSQLAAFYENIPVFEVPNGVDVQQFQVGITGDTIRQAHKIPLDAIVVLYVGALDRAHHNRRVDILLKAVARLDAVHIMIVGDGDTRVDYENLVEELNITARTYFLGKRAHADLPSIYAAADIVVLPSYLQEAFGMVLIEGMALAKPVITSNLPGVRTVVQDGENGFLVEPLNIEELADKISYLATHSTERAQMGQDGLRRVQEKYQWNSIAKELIQIYESTINNE